jgi:hypothetical protein
MKKPLISAHFWTERALGTADKAIQFLSTMQTLDGGKWVPDIWSQFEESPKYPFAHLDENRFIHLWTEERYGRISNSMIFRKNKPRLLLDVHSWKGRVPDLNWLWFDMEASEFVGGHGVDRLKRIVCDFVSWSGAAYATVKHSNQLHYRSSPGNPSTRLDQLNWLSFFGAPYVRLFSAERIRGCSFYSCEQFANGLLVTAAEHPDSPSMTEANQTLISLEKCLGSDAFASDTDRDVPCAVPEFKLDETVKHS